MTVSMNSCLLIKDMLLSASTSIVGTGLAIGGMVRASFTFGGSMPLTAAGTGIGTVLGADIINGILQSSKVKHAQKALEEDEKVAQEFSLEIENVQKLAKKVKRDVYFKRGKLVYHIRHKVKKIASISSTIASSSDEAASTILPLLGKTYAKSVLAANVGLAAVSLAVDGNTIVDTFIQVHMSSVVEVVEDIRDTAQKLEDTICDFDDTSIDLYFVCQLCILADWLMRASRSRLSSFYGNFYVCK
ncbi:uncharacterized protein LOC124454784 [Xenia sp. Carnegie-2017]|uniref:uncharacterized protein LOC124454784 n=1 Tax=Xenia sp. Carnegie-2017 TaxID=2897299 RepID=UPI001F048582|nr:uncharacterized protein LOC124454784 [Xenia sp. Carnegie-2017]